MNAQNLIAAIRHVWLFIVPPILNLMLLGLVIEGTFGDTLSPYIGRLQTLLAGYFADWWNLVNALLSALSGVDSKTVAAWAGAASSAGRGVFFVLLLALFVVALVVEWATRQFAKIGRSVGRCAATQFDAPHANRSGCQQIHTVSVSDAMENRDWHFVPDHVLHRPSFSFARQQFVNPVTRQAFGPAELHRIVLAWLSQNARDGRDSFVNRREVAESANFLRKLQDYCLAYLMICIAYVISCMVFGGIRRLAVATLVATVVALWLICKLGARARWNEVGLDFDAFYYLKIAAAGVPDKKAEQ
ncbi:MAG: hypothetical protein WDN25_13560 [Acetobacteraceae bacterium]